MTLAKALKTRWRKSGTRAGTQHDAMKQEAAMAKIRRRDDDDEVVRDGEALRVPMMLTDAQLAELPSWQRVEVLKWRARGTADLAPGVYPAGAGAREGGTCTIDGRLGRLRKQSDGTFLCVVDGSDDAIATAAPAVVTDAFGDSGLALRRPGSRYLHAGVKSRDYAVQSVRELERREAFADSVRDLGETWKGGANDREVARVHNTGNPVADAYLDGVTDLTTAWSRGPGRR
jgi:hypothetical protein